LHCEEAASEMQRKWPMKVMLAPCKWQKHRHRFFEKKMQIIIPNVSEMKG
jgi:hypothetical protein